MHPISKVTVHNKAYQQLKAAIMSAYFEPGEILTLRSLSTLFGTSDMPVREALKQLAAERAVEALPNRSTRIPVHSVKRMQEIVDLRVLLEGYAAAAAATHATAAEIEAIAAEQIKAVATIAANDVKTYLHHNTNFHFLIYRASRVETIVPIIESLWLQYAPTFRLSLARIAAHSEQLEKVSSNHHDGIVRALKRRDREAARREMEADIVEPTKTPDFWRLLGEPADDAS